MNKIKLSIIALSCAMALGACSSSSKGGSDNSEQIRQAEVELNQRIAEANKKADAAVKKAEAAIKTAKNNSEQTEAEKKAAEERLKQLENLQADEKARIPLSDKVFGGISGEMKDTISGGTINLEKNELNSVLTSNIRNLTIREKDGRLKDVEILRTAGELDPENFGEPYDDPYNLRQYRQTILSNSNFQASAFGTYIDELTDQYFFAQGNPTALAQIPTAGKVEYDGGAVYKKDGDYGRITGMTATADFANKVIDINIKERGKFVPGMNFGGKITGNSFAGEVNGIKTQGGFFGKDAQEMTGLFTNEADKSRGAFGGIKK